MEKIKISNQKILIVVALIVIAVIALAVVGKVLGNIFFFFLILRLSESIAGIELSSQICIAKLLIVSFQVVAVVKL